MKNDYFPIDSISLLVCICIIYVFSSFDVYANNNSGIEMKEDSVKRCISRESVLPITISYLNAKIDQKENKAIMQEAQIDCLKRDINRMNNYILIKDQKISELDQIVSDLKGTITEQKRIIEKQAKIIEVQDSINNTGHIVIGTKKQLKEAGIITSSMDLVPGSLTSEICQTIDIRNIKEISLNSKKPKVLSQMPPQSYVIQKSPNGKSCTLIIKDSALFWSQSYYLIIIL